VPCRAPTRTSAQLSGALVSIADKSSPRELQRVEEALVADAIAAGEAVHRSPSAPPAPVLGVRVPRAA
jgi:hypothetical protein